MKVKGSTFDWAQFKQNQYLHWEVVGTLKSGAVIFRCNKHNICFQPDPLCEEDPNAEPCWKCYDECVVEITKDTCHFCTICKKNWVDSDNGFDTCQECLGKA